MGIIAKQSIKGTLLLYAAIIIGFINTGLIFPKVLNTEQIGLLNILISYAAIIGQFGNLGFTNTIIKFFPYFENKGNHHNGFLKIITLISFFGFILSIGLFFLIKTFLLKENPEKSTLLFEYIYLLLPLIFFTIYFNAYDAYYRALKNSVPGIFYKEFLIRIMVLVLIILYYFKLFDFKSFVMLYVAVYSFPALGIIFSLITFNEFNFWAKIPRLKKMLKKTMISVSFYSIISSFSGIFLVSVDRIVLERYNGLSDVGIYSVSFFFASLISISARPIVLVTGSIISDFWKQKNMTQISEIYKSTSINQFIVGLLFLIGIWANIHIVYQILPKEYLIGKYVILILGFSFLTDMISGASVNILALSRYYKYHTYFMVGFIVLAVVTNILLIPIYGMLGAALASLISKFIYNLIRVVFLQLKFKLFPYDKKFLIVLIVGGFTYYISSLLTISENVYLDFVVRSSFISIVYLFLIYIFKISNDFNIRVNKVYNYLKNYR